MSLNAIRENKVLAKISESTVFCHFLCITLLTLCMLGIVFYGVLSSADTFQHSFFQNILP